jgi:hypothetical protein
MLRITVSKNQNATTLRIEGRLAGPWVEELVLAWQAVVSDPSAGRAAVDLTDVTFVSEEGKKALEVIHGEGAKLMASRCATRRLVEEIERNFHRSPSVLGALNAK